VREQKADTDEFDESVPLPTSGEDAGPLGQLERNFSAHLSPVERYALRFSVHHLDPLTQLEKQHDIASGILPPAPAPSASESTSKGKKVAATKAVSEKAKSGTVVAKSSSKSPASVGSALSSSSSDSDSEQMSVQSREDAEYRAVTDRLYEEAHFELVEKRSAVVDAIMRDDADLDEGRPVNENDHLFYQGSSTDAVRAKLTALQQEEILIDSPLKGAWRALPRGGNDAYVSPLAPDYDTEV
jgi:hypothetical protein